MPKNFSEFLEMMDQRFWFRMVVCLSPGLVAAKLFGVSENGSFLYNIGTAVLIIGVALYALWPRIRGLSNVDDAAAEDEEEGAGTEVAGREQLALLAELRAVCREGDRESDQLIAVEIAVDPTLTYAQATKNALARRKMVR